MLAESVHPITYCRILDEVFTYNHIARMFLRNRSHVKASMVLTRADLYLYIII